MRFRKIYVEISNLCNLNCAFCPGTHRPPGRMTVEQFQKLLQKLRPYTEFLYFHLMGEPLTHPHLPAFLRLAAQKGFRSVITTNGTLLKKCGAAILEAGIHKVNISLHSFEAHDLQGYERYLTEVAEFADAASKAGVVVVFRLWNRGYDGGQNDQAIRFLQSRLDGEWAENTRGIRIREKFYVEWGDRFQWPDKDADIQGDTFFCYGMRDHFGILCDGSVVPCCLDSDGIITLGNIFTENIADILASPRAAAITKGFERHMATEELCRRCSYAQRFV